MSGAHRRAVLFDMDGVLILSAAAHYRSWRETARARGVDLSEARFKETFGRTNQDSIRELFGELPADEVLRIADQKERHWRAAIAGSVPLAPGAVAVCTALRDAGWALALGSSAPPENVAAVLSGTGLRALLEVVVDGAMVRRGKPDPEVFVRCAERLGVAAARCVVVEDAPAGIQAARAAGMAAIGVTSAHPEAALRAAGAHDVIAALTELLPARAAACLGAGT
ncbi:MAG: HAD family hydrolase [Planctomycetota bacterium]